MSIRVYNTLTKKKEEFVTAVPRQIKMYVCGPTTYNYIHLGNARALIVFDTIRSYLEYKGYRVFYVQNFTDVDDKIIKRAAEEGVEALALGSRFIDEYFRDADALRIKRATVHPKVSEHIPEIIAAVQELLDKGFAYQIDGDVFFSVRSFPDYGKLSGRSLEEMQAGARVEVDQRKKDPLDFILWKASKPGEPFWESPWGLGRPGWHIECSVMSLKYLGASFDIHGGGHDLIFPHHENEIAQAEAMTGKAPFARYWLHNGFVTVNEEKMSKSLGNFFIVRELLQEWPPEVIRFFLLSTHYRNPLDFSLENLASARRSYNRLLHTVELLEEVTGGKESVLQGRLSREAEKMREQVSSRIAEFEAAMDDDFNTSLALAALFNLARDVNSMINNKEYSQTPAMLHMFIRVRSYFLQLLDVLGLLPGEDRQLGEEFTALLGQTAGEFRDALRLPARLPEESSEMLALLLTAREEARKRKDYKTADAFRDALKKIGIILEDTPRGVRWRIV